MNSHIPLKDLRAGLKNAAAQQGTYIRDQEGVEDLRQAAIWLDRLNNEAANGILRWDPRLYMNVPTWTDKDESVHSRADERTQQRAREAMAKTFGPKWTNHFILEFKGDPRLGAINVCTPNGELLLTIW
jgi:hypothetical protein